MRKYSFVALRRSHNLKRNSHVTFGLAPLFFAGWPTHRAAFPAFWLSRQLHSSAVLPYTFVSTSFLPSSSPLDVRHIRHTMAATAFRTARIELPKTAFFLCDMQERFKTAIANFDLITNTSARMLKAAKILDVPVFTTEQNPKGRSSTNLHTTSSPFAFNPN